MTCGSVQYGQQKADGIVTNIVTTVAEEKDVEPVDLAPLYDTIDPDLLASFAEVMDPTTSVRFQYCGWKVSVEGDGTVQLQQPPDHE